MRSEKAFRNSIISFLVQFGTAFLVFLVRKIFVLNLDIEYLGYEGLFNNIFSLMSVAELGLSSIITYNLYKEIAGNNKDEICKLMSVYKWFYRVIAIGVTVAGIIVFFFLPYIVKDVAKNYDYVKLIYLIQLFGVVSGYFLSYKRTLLSADQKDYICVEIDFASKFAISVVQILGLIIFHDFILYICIKIVGEILANIVVAFVVNRDYPYVKKKIKITKEELVRRNIFSDARNFLVHKMAYLVYGSTDNIVIATFCGIKDVALFGNYILVAGNVKSMLFYKLLNPLQASIGSYVYSEKSRERQMALFNMLDMCGFFMAVALTSGFLIFFQPFIAVWLGDEFKLSFAFVVVYCVTSYIGAVFEIVYKYRSAFGDYAKDRNWMILSAAINLIVSVLAAPTFGVVGVQFGTLLGMVATVHGRIVFVMRNYLHESVLTYYKKHLLWFSFALVQCIVLYLVTVSIPETIIGIIVRLFIWGAFIFTVNGLTFYKTNEMHLLIEYILHLFNKFYGRLKNGKENN